MDVPPSGSGARLVLLMPYFGRWPEWINLYIETCSKNPQIDWLLFTDCGEPANKAANVRIIPMTLAEFGERARATIGVPFTSRDPYKICDLRPAFGSVFADVIRGYDFFGFGDLDVVYGDLQKFLSPEVLEHDVISFHHDRLSGHLCFFRNTESLRRMHERIEWWQDRMRTPRWLGVDDALAAVLTEERRYFHESYNTPLARDRAWTDGSYTWPSEWYWRAGILTNDKDGARDFPYLHFMIWKGGVWGHFHGGAQWERLPRLVHFPWHDAPYGWKVNETGFHRLPGQSA